MAKKAKLSSRVVNFKCELDCGGRCCTGLSFALPAEIKYLYDKVPLVLTLEAIMKSILNFSRFFKMVLLLND